MMIDSVRKHPSSSLASLGSAMALTLLASANVSADTPDPIPSATKITVQVNPDNSLTVTASGKWQWTTRNNDCNIERFATGWAVDWGDPDQIGNYVGDINNVPIHVGVAVGNARNPADNKVHYYSGNDKPRCGVYGTHGNARYNTGDWGPISHTYKNVFDAAKNSICVVMYDIHKGKAKKQGLHEKDDKHDKHDQQDKHDHDDKHDKHDKHGKPGKPGGPGKPGDQAFEPKEGDLIAGGDRHNHDNSVQDNARTPLGNQCIRVSIPIDDIPTLN